MGAGGPRGARPALFVAAPSDARAAALAVGGDVALVARRDGTLALVDLGRGEEVDLDDDPATTTRGAPEGVTRFDLGEDSLPDGAALTPDGRIALVALRGTEEVVVLDLLERAVLPLAKWDGSREHIRPPFTRSGGCWNARGSEPAPCEPTLTLDGPVEALVKSGP